MEFQNLQELKEYVVVNQGVATLSMRTIKDAAKQGDSLKKYVRERITNELNKYGLIHSGDELPNYQQAFVRIYQSGTSVAAVIEAAKSTDEGEKGIYDKILREAAAKDQTDMIAQVESLKEEVEMLDRIRAILQCNEN